MSETTTTAPPPPGTTDTKRTKQWLAVRLQPARRLNGLAVAIGTAGGLLMIAQAWLLASVIAAAIMDGQRLGDLTTPLLLLLPVFLGRALCVWASEAVGMAAANRVKAPLRREMADSLVRAGPARSAESHSGAAASLLVDQVEAVEGYVARYRPQMTLAVTVPAAILVAAFATNWVVGLILLLTAPLIPLFMALVGMGTAAMSRRQFKALSRMSGHFLDRLRGMTTLILFGQTDREVQGVAQVADAFRQRTMSVLRVAFLSSAVLEFFASIAVAMVAVYIGLSLLGHLAFGPSAGLDLQTGLFLLLLAPDFYLPLRQLAAFYHDRAQAFGAGEELAAFRDRSGTQVTVPAAGRPVIEGPPEISLSGVHLAYDDGSRPALTGFDLTLPPGEVVALTGPSGAGKSSVLQLLLGFRTADAGRVALAGTSIEALAPADLRALVAWAGQRPYVFHGSLADNLRLGRPDADDEAVRAAAEAACVTDFADALPEGLETLVGERGHGLSGGQIRRVALARALLSPARLLLFDEPTANLDGDTEAELLRRLRPALAGRTVLVATHSPVVAAWCDREVRITAGRTDSPAEAAQ